MKKILLISNEDSENEPGLIHGEAFGVAPGLRDIQNLTAAIADVCDDSNVKVIQHTQIQKIADYTPDCVVLSGRFSDKALDNQTILSKYAALIDWIKESTMPVLGICMGLQLICAAFGMDTKRMSDENGERGFVTLSSVCSHPLLESVPSKFRCFEKHCCEVTSLPEDFALLVKSDACAIQMIAHKTRPIVGTQFHPEIITGEHSDGFKILNQFFKVYL